MGKRKCSYCQRNFSAEVGGKLYPSIDHFIPVSRGGSQRPQNKIKVCRECNSGKTNLLPHEFIFQIADTSIGKDHPELISVIVRNVRAYIRFKYPEWNLLALPGIKRPQISKRVAPAPVTIEKYIERNKTKLDQTLVQRLLAAKSQNFHFLE